MIKISKSHLRKLIIEGLNEETTAQAKTGQALQQFLDHLQGAKQALSLLVQASTDHKAMDQGKALLDGINRITKAINNMPELTRDTWHGASKMR
jgi:hypothetical protein